MLMSPFDRRSSSDTYLPSLAILRRSAFAIAIRSFFTPTVSIVARGDEPPTDADFACCVYKYAPIPTAISTPMNPTARPMAASSEVLLHQFYRPLWLADLVALRHELLHHRL